MAATIVVNPDGQVFKASEEQLGVAPLTPQTHQLLAQFQLSKPPMDNPLQANHNPLIEDTMLMPNLSDTMRGIGTLRAAQDGQANSENLSHLQLIRLFPQIQGTPEKYFYLEEAFVKRDMPKLEGRESWHDTVSTAQYLDRLEQSKAIQTKYDEIKYSLNKLVDKVYTPIEDVYRTIINPQEIDLSQLRWGFARRRNLSALEAIKKITKPSSGKGSTKLEKIDTVGSNFHSANKTATVLNDTFNEFLKKNDVSITHVIMNPKVFADYAENTWTKNGPANIMPERIAGGGVVNMPGLANITAIVDVHVPDYELYAINKTNALRLAEGPKLMRRYYDEERDANAIKVIDFHQHLAVNTQLTKLDRKYGMKIEFKDA